MNAWLSRLIQPLMPPVETLCEYRWADLMPDLIAGLTVSVVDLPQSMAFAVIAGVNPVYGIYTAVIQAFLGGLFTSSRFLSNGPTNTQSLLVAAIVSRLANPHVDGARYLQLVIGLTLLKGVIQLLFAAARMGRLVRYVSNSVMVGFTAGAGVLIVLEQIPNFLGLPRGEPGAHALPGLPGAVMRMWPHLGEINHTTLWIGVGVLVGVLTLHKISKWMPGPLLGVVGAAALVWWQGWAEGAVRVVGALPSGLPRFQVPDLHLLDYEHLLGGALAMALLGMLESVSIAKAIAVRTNQHVDANQEFFGQGISNLVAGFFQCIPGSGSFSRSALQYSVGARTRVASVFCAAFNLIIFLALAAEARFIPYAALAAILFIVGVKLIDVHNLRKIFRSSPADAVVCAITFLAALLLPLTYAIYVGIFFNLAQVIHRSSQLRVAEMVRSSAGSFVEQPLREKQGPRTVLFLQIEGDLFFGIADELRARLTRVYEQGSLVVIFRLKRTHTIDSTVMRVIEDFTRQMRDAGRYVILCGVREDLMMTLGHFGLLNVIGQENVFPATYGVFASAQHALDRAKELLGSSLDLTGFSDHEEVTGWSYEI